MKKKGQIIYWDFINIIGQKANVFISKKKV